MPAMDNAHALIIGIARYQSLDITPLPETVTKDAKDIYELLIDPHHCAYPPDNVQLLLNEQATQEAILQALEKMAKETDPESVVSFYISSHGGRISSGEHAGNYLLPVDADGITGAPLARTAISGDVFTEALRKIPARKVTVMFDCCHSGGIGQPKDATEPVLKSGLSDEYYDALKSGQGRVILASSRSTESSWVLPNAENSLFSQHLLTGLRGGIPSEDGLIRIFDLFEYIQPRITSDKPNQHPIFKAEVEENFPVALYLGGQKGVNPPRKDAQGFQYDAYISYAEEHDADADWVWETLVPRLEDVGLNVAISDDVREPGVARVVNIERGIKQSRRIVVILSPNYLTDNMAQFENVMAQTKGIEEKTVRLLSVIIDPVDKDKLPYRLNPKIVEPVDLTRPGRRATRGLDKLVETLKKPLPSLFET